MSVLRGLCLLYVLCMLLYIVAFSQSLAMKYGAKQSKQNTIDCHEVDSNESTSRNDRVVDSHLICMLLCANLRFALQ